MVGLQAYGTIQFSSENTPGVGNVLPGRFNTASAIQDPNNINAGLIRINFVTPFLVPPVVVIQPVRAGVNWVSPGSNPFMPDGANIHRNVFPIPPSQTIDGEVDEILDIPVARVFESGALPSGGRPMPISSKIEVENRLLAYRLLNVERSYVQVQFATFLGQVIRVRPFTLEGVDGVDDVQHGVVNEILFAYMAAGDLDTF